MRLLVGLAEYLQATMSLEQLEMYTKEFDSAEYLGACIVALKKDPDIRSGFMPLPAKIKAALEKSVEDQAYETVNKILRCATEIGHYQAASARDTMGPVAWSVVQAYGGWQTVCQIDTKAIGTAFAQLRDIAISMEKVNRIGGMREFTGIEGPRRKAELGEKGSVSLGELVHQKVEEIARRKGSDK